MGDADKPTIESSDSVLDGGEFLGPALGEAAGNQSAYGVARLHGTARNVLWKG